MKYIFAFALALMFTMNALAQTPAEFAAIDAAGKAALIAGTKVVPDPQDATKQVTVRDTDKVIVRAPRYDPLIGAQTGTQDVEFSISGMNKDIANMEAALVLMKAQRDKLQAVK